MKNKLISIAILLTSVAFSSETYRSYFDAYKAGTAAEAAGKPEEAINAFQEAVKLSKDDVAKMNAFQMQANLYARQKKEEKALNVYDEAIKTVKKTDVIAQLTIRKAIYLNQLKKYEECIALCDNWLKQPTKASAHTGSIINAQAFAMISLKQNDDAAAALEDIYSKIPVNANSVRAINRSHCGDALMALKKYADAGKAYQAIETIPCNPILKAGGIAGHAKALSAAQKHQEAVSVAEKLLTLDGFNAAQYANNCSLFFKICMTGKKYNSILKGYDIYLAECKTKNYKMHPWWSGYIDGFAAEAAIKAGNTTRAKEILKRIIHTEKIPVNMKKKAKENLAKLP